MKVGLWSTTAANNNSTPPDGWPEGQAPSTVNDCARENMAATKTALQDMDFFDHAFSPTFVNANSFTVPGNQTARLNSGRKLKLFDATTHVRAIGSASFTTVTTVSLGAGTALTSSLSSFAVGILDPLFNFIPDTLSIDATAVNTGTLSVSGNAVVSSNLFVGGTTTLSGATTLLTTLTVSGAAVFNGATRFDTTLTASGAVTLLTTLQVAGAVSLGSALYVNGTFTASAAVTLKTTLSVGGAAVFGAAVQANTTMTVSGATALLSTLSVSGVATFASNVNVLAAMSVSADVVAATFRSGISSASANTGVATTVFAIPNVAIVRMWLFSINIGNGTGDAPNYAAAAIIMSDGATTRTAQAMNSTLVTVTLSGLNVQATQNSGATQTFTCKRLLFS